jgi:hypothetical protein
VYLAADNKVLEITKMKNDFNFNFLMSVIIYDCIETWVGPASLIQVRLVWRLRICPDISLHVR